MSNATFSGVLSNILAGESVSKIEIAWMLVGTDVTAADAVTAGRALVWNAGTDDAKITAFQAAGQLIDVGILVDGATYTPTVRVSKIKSDTSILTGVWSTGAGTGLTTTTTTAAPISGVYDSFTGTNGSALDSTKWNTPFDLMSTAAAGSTLNIQDNRLLFHFKAASGTYIKAMTLKQTLSTAAGRYFEITVAQMLTTNGGLHSTIYSPETSAVDVNGFPTIHNIECAFLKVGIYQKIHITTTAAAGAVVLYTNEAHTNVDHVFRFTLVDPTHLTVTMDGTPLITNVLVAAVFGANIKAGLYFAANTSVFDDISVDNLTFT